MTLNRRAILGATAAFAAAPATSFAAPAAPIAPKLAATVEKRSIRALWDQVIDLSIRMNGHVHEAATADRGTGLPGWMYVQGEANELGNKRYDALVAILNAKPETAEDVSIIARAATHGDIQAGPQSFATARLASAAMSLAA